MTPADLRAVFRAGGDADTGGLALGFVQASVTVVAASEADAFEAFCRRNPLSCPLLEILPPGVTRSTLADGSDVRTDMPGYRVVRNGQTSDVRDIVDLWSEDLVTFLLGCGYTQLGPLIAAGVRPEFLATGEQQPVYVSSLRTAPVGQFGGPIAVSMLALEPADVARAVETTIQLPFAHGGPIWIGDPAPIGIDLDRPASGIVPRIRPGQVPVFWACTQTLALAAIAGRTPLLIQHAPARMFVTDRRIEEIMT